MQMRDVLRDPDSNVRSQQPSYARNEYRSIVSQSIWSSLVPVHAWVACRLTVPSRQLRTWRLAARGGYVWPCHGSRFDVARRVYKGVPAPTNFVVPPHRYLRETLCRLVLILNPHDSVRRLSWA